MYNASDKSYLQTRAIKRGQHKLIPTHQQLVDWIKDTLNINVLDFTCETKETSAGYRQQMLFIIIETFSDEKKVSTQENEDLIREKFMEYFTLNDPVIRNFDPLKKDIFPLTNGSFPETLICFRPLEEIELKIAKEKVRKDLTFIEKYKEHVWRYDIETVFYYTDAQVKENRQNGISQAIENELLENYKKYDEFNYFGSHSIAIVFDSKETFDRDFEGKDWVYYR